MDQIDFRSDTVTWPTPEMRQAMAHARVGDDVYGEDPTVKELEALAAERTGKEAGLFVASGTMGNLVAILSHAGRGDEAILGLEAHTFVWEGGAMSTLGGVAAHPLPTDRDGRMQLPAVEAAVRDANHHFPRSRLILVENTFGGRGGFPLPPEYFADIRRIADHWGLAVHLDGARLFNAAVALDLDARELTKDVDSVTFCLSKGLCAPIGSVLCASQQLIERARYVRKHLGGGMRQAGVLAAAGLLALGEMVPRLGEDHVNARALAKGLAEIPGILIEPERVRTNIVHFRLAPTAGIRRKELIRRLKEEHQIGLGKYPPDLLRALTHYWIGRREVAALLDALRGILAPA